jgi:hypothetical protein
MDPTKGVRITFKREKKKVNVKWILSLLLFNHKKKVDSSFLSFFAEDLEENLHTLDYKVTEEDGEILSPQFTNKGRKQHEHEVKR